MPPSFAWAPVALLSQTERITTQDEFLILRSTNEPLHDGCRFGQTCEGWHAYFGAASALAAGCMAIPPGAVTAGLGLVTATAIAVAAIAGAFAAYVSAKHTMNQRCNAASRCEDDTGLGLENNPERGL